MAHVSVVSRSSQRFQSTLAKHRAFWSRAPANSYLRSDGVFAASVPVRLPQANGRAITQAERLTPDMIDPDCLIDEVMAWDPAASDAAHIAEEETLASIGIGDLLPFSQPFFKIPWIEAMLGCPIVMTEGQIWVGRYEGDVDALAARGICFEGNPWLALYEAFLRRLQDRAAARYPVTANTLLRGPCDLVAALTGVKEAAMGWLDAPERMARLMRLCTDANLAVIEAAQRVLAPADGLHVSGFGVCAPGPVVRTQADHSSLLGPGIYEAQIRPFDEEVISALPSCVFHIHNNGLHVAPLLVEIAALDVVQVVVDPYPRGERKHYEVEMLRQIQERKPLIVDVNLPSVAEGEWLLAQLSRRGLCFNARYSPAAYGEAAAGLPGAGLWLLD